MILNCICSRIKSIFLAFLSVFKRALCIINRRRASNSNFEPLETISIVRSSNYNNIKVSRVNWIKNSVSLLFIFNFQEKDWNTWDDTPRTVEEHIEKYREKLAKPPTPTDNPTEPDFFAIEGLVPKIIKQEKILIATNDDTKMQSNNFSRLQATADIPVHVSFFFQEMFTLNEKTLFQNELKDWEELEQQGWEEADDENTKQMIREKRKEIRYQQRYQNQQQTNYGTGR